MIDGLYTQQGTHDLTAHFSGEVVSQFPKPVGLMKELIEIGAPTGDGEVVLDFFAGSSTTGEAVLALNHEQGESRRAVLVQLPEPIDEATVAGRAGFQTIAEVGAERLRRALGKVSHDSQGMLGTGDSPVGLRVFKLAPSNFRQWEPVDAGDPDGLMDQMGLFVDPLVDGWEPEAVLWEIALKEGYALHSRVEQLEEVALNTVWRVTDPDKQQSFLICLDQEVHEATVAALRLSADDLFVCRDVALSDTLAANLALQCRLKTI